MTENMIEQEDVDVEGAPDTPKTHRPQDDDTHWFQDDDMEPARSYQTFLQSLDRPVRYMQPKSDADEDQLIPTMVVDDDKGMDDDNGNDDEFDSGRLCMDF
jgi:hypothetical protein